MGVSHISDLAKACSRAWYRSVMPNLVLATIAVIVPSVIAAQVQTWFLMAPDEKMVGAPGVATRMEHGPMLGPLEFTSRAKFSSRAECEPARQKLITQWRQLSVIKRGSWNKYGFQSPSVFVRCIPADDPQLKRSGSGAEAAPSMETFLNRPTHR